MASSKPSYYEILGVSEDCSQEDLKKSFRKLSLQYHPDKKPGTEEKFKDILNAYTTLSDPVTRQNYDLGLGDAGNLFFSDDLYSFLQKFNELFRDLDPSSSGGTYQTIPRQKSAPRVVPLQVQLSEICNGTIREVKLKLKVHCSQCKYSQLPMCNRCSGQQFLEVEKTFSVNVKQGMLDGQEIFMFGEGDEEPQKSVGDLIFKIEYLKDHEFQYKPIQNIVYKAIIPLYQAVWGIDFVVRTPNQESNLHLKKSIKGKMIRNGDKMYILNEGVPDYWKPERRGNLIVDFTVKWPKTLSQEQVQKIMKLFCLNGAADTSDKSVYFLEELQHEDESQKNGDLFPITYLYKPPTGKIRKAAKKMRKGLTHMKAKFWTSTDVSTASINKSKVDDSSNPANLEENRNSVLNPSVLNWSEKEKSNANLQSEFVPLKILSETAKESQEENGRALNRDFDNLENPLNSAVTLNCFAVDGTSEDTKSKVDTTVYSVNCVEDLTCSSAQAIRKTSTDPHSDVDSGAVQTPPKEPIPDINEGRDMNHKDHDYVPNVQNNLDTFNCAVAVTLGTVQDTSKDSKSNTDVNIMDGHTNSFNPSASDLKKSFDSWVLVQAPLGNDVTRISVEETVSEDPANNANVNTMNRTDSVYVPNTTLEPISNVDAVTSEDPKK